LARPGDLLAIIAARARLLLAANQDLLQVGDHFAIAEGRFVNFGTLDVGSWERIRKLSLLPQARAPQKRVTGFMKNQADNRDSANLHRLLVVGFELGDHAFQQH
jgi:hypothetical protein